MDFSSKTNSSAHFYEMQSQEDTQAATLAALVLAQQIGRNHFYEMTSCAHCKNQPRFDHDSIYVGSTRLTKPLSSLDARNATYVEQSKNCVHLSIQYDSDPFEYVSMIFRKDKMRVELASKLCLETTAFETITVPLRTFTYRHYRIPICSHILNDWEDVLTSFVKEINSREK